MANSNTQDWLGNPISRKAVSHFIFVQHRYPRLSERRPHSHPWFHLSIVQRGLYARSLGTRISHYRAGTMALLATDESHTDSFAPGTKCLHMVIPSHLETLLARDFASRGRTPFTPLHPINAQCAVALYREFERPDGHSPFVIEAVLLDMVSRELGLATERSCLRPPWIRTALQYLDETYGQPWSLTDVAREVGVHPVYLCRAFSEHLGMTLGQYVRKLRVLRGRQLLSIGNDGKMADIANESGFADESHFSREFRNAYGISPGRYSRIVKG
jgi:AraC-like DNA-binding protein